MKYGRKAFAGGYHNLPSPAYGAMQDIYICVCLCVLGLTPDSPYPCHPQLIFNYVHCILKKSRYISKILSEDARYIFKILPEDAMYKTAASNLKKRCNMVVNYNNGSQE